MLWNADVERRRREYHEKRCEEDPIYRRAYERQQEMMQRIQKMTGVAMAQLANAMADDKDIRPTGEPGRIIVPKQMQKPLEKTMRYYDNLRKMDQDIKASVAGFGGDLLSAGVLAMIFADPEVEKRLKELLAEKPYAEEIRKADAEFDREIIRLNGFEW